MTLFHKKLRGRREEEKLQVMETADCVLIIVIIQNKISRQYGALTELQVAPSIYPIFCQVERDASDIRSQYNTENSIYFNTIGDKSTHSI